VIYRLIAGIASLALALVGCWLCRRWLPKGLKWVVYHTLETSEMWGLAETFWNEAAVLYFVFPIVDSVYQRTKDKPPLSTNGILGTLGAVLVFFSVSLFCKKRHQHLAEKEMQERRA
jgi:hypothetical protein